MLKTPPTFQTLAIKARIALAMAAAALTTACGGGGGAAPVTPPTPTPPPPPALAIPVAGTLITSIPTPTYATGSFEALMIQRLNALRQAAGAGLLQQSTTLDAAAFGHQKWMALNGSVTHVQPTGSPGFTGATVADRIANAGFAGATVFSETISGRFRTDDPTLCLPTAAPYHFAALMGSFTHVGLSQVESATIPGSVVPAGQFGCVANFAMTDTNRFGQVPPSGAMIASPADGSKAYYRGDIGGEIPRVPTSIVPTEFAGTPVFVSVRNADYINWRSDGTLSVTVTQFEIKDDLGNVLPVAIVSNNVLRAGPGVVLNPDTNVPDGSAVLIPLAQLTIGKVYRVNFSATLKTGAPALTKSWTFTATATGL